MITQKQLDVGATAVMELAKKYRVHWYLNMDKCREVTATVLKAVEALETKDTKKETVNDK